MVANPRDFLVVTTTGKNGTTEHKIKVSDLKVPQEVLDQYGPDAMTEGESTGICLNTINGVRWSFFEDLGVVKPLDPDAEGEPVDAGNGADSALDN
jgi:hypothetical protein